MLKIVDVSKSFGDVIALEKVNLNVDRGDFVFVTGPSGSGKTTLLRLILREILPDSGEITVNGVSIGDLSEKEIPTLRQSIGVVFQDFKVLPERTVRENVEVALAVANVKEADWKIRVDNVLELVELIDRSELFPLQLSGGELQRVAMARALVVNPKLLLADEPTGNLDWDTADRLMELFEKINKEGKTIVMATHHRGIINKLGKKKVVLPKVRRKKKNKTSRPDQNGASEKNVLKSPKAKQKKK